MSNKPFRRGDKKRLLRVCDVVREHLGIGNIPAIYEFLPSDYDQGESISLAASFVYKSGWRLRIQFYDPFFKENDLRSQIDTIVHEHLHAAMQPYDQILLRMEGLILKKDLPQFEENIHVAREITVDRLCRPLATLMEPHLRKVL